MPTHLMKMNDQIAPTVKTATTVQDFRWDCSCQAKPYVQGSFIPEKAE